MSNLVLGALSLLLSTNRPAVVSDYLTETLAPFGSANRVDPNDPLELEFQALLKLDDDAEEEIDRILASAPAPDPNQPSDRYVKREAVRQQLLVVVNRVRGKYEAFLALHPDHVRARLAYADYLDSHGDVSEVLEQLKRALDYDPENAVTWNNYANHFAHVGPITNGFAAYEKAIALKPFEPLYRYNFGTTVFLYRKDAMEYFGCDEQGVFERALSEYRICRKLAPTSFRYAFEYAQTFYGVKPAPSVNSAEKRAAEERLATQAMTAWNEALDVADNETDREGIFLHLARWQIKLGHPHAARTNLVLVTRPEHAELKNRLTRNLLALEAGESIPFETDALPSGSIPSTPPKK